MLALLLYLPHEVSPVKVHLEVSMPLLLSEEEEKEHHRVMIASLLLCKKVSLACRTCFVFHAVTIIIGALDQSKASENALSSTTYVYVYHAPS